MRRKTILFCLREYRQTLLSIIVLSMLFMYGMAVSDLSVNVDYTHTATGPLYLDANVFVYRVCHFLLCGNITMRQCILACVAAKLIDSFV